MPVRGAKEDERVRYVLRRKKKRGRLFLPDISGTSRARDALASALTALLNLGLHEHITDHRVPYAASCGHSKHAAPEAVTKYAFALLHDWL